MTEDRQYPERPVIAVGGVVISEGRALLIRRGQAPLEGRWSIPGGILELGETIADGIARELFEETGVRAGALDLIEVYEKVLRDAGDRAQYHFVILDYLCELEEGTPHPGSDVTEVAWVREEELKQFQLTGAATRVVRKAFAMARERGKAAHG